MPPSPSAVAREALKQLAERRLAPSPDNYARAYYEIASPGRELASLDPAAMLQEVAEALRQKGGDPAKDGATLEGALATGDWNAARAALLAMSTRAAASADEGDAWAGLLRDLITQWEARIPGVTQARKRQALEHQLNAFKGSSAALYPRLKSLLRSWREASDAPPADASAPGAGAAAWQGMEAPAVSAREAGAALPAAGTSDEEAKTLLRELLAQTLQFGVVERMGYSPQLALEAQALASTAREAATPAALAAVAGRLKKFWLTLEIRGEDQREIQEGLLRLLRLTAGNIAEMIDEESWLRGQMQAVETLVSQPVDSKAIGDMERMLRDVAFKQGSIKHSRDEARDALKALLAAFVDRLGTIADDAGGYHDRMEQFAGEIAKADDIGKLASIVSVALQETRSIQASVKRTREEIAAAKEKADGYHARVQQLEAELANLSDRLHEDALTLVLNRRGLDRSFDVEAARADRQNEVMFVAILDVDNFKLVNDRYGHHAGDLALVHLANVVRAVIRPFDVIARFGGEEFVILLPHTTVEQAEPVLARVQRQLTKRFFMHNNERVLITFSAGVTARTVGEGEDTALARADKALYRAKQAGKNRVELG